MAKKKTPKLPLIEIVSILDRSGSMSTIAKETIGSYNHFINEQRKIPGDVNVTTVLFDDRYDILYEAVKLQDVIDLNETTYVPRGYTALYDAVGKTIQTISERLSKTSKKDLPEKVIAIILTDGEENASKEYNSKKVKELIEEKQKLNWEFIFLASELNQFEDTTFNSIHKGAKKRFSASIDPDDGDSMSLNALGSNVTTDFLNDYTSNVRNKVYSNSDLKD